MPSSAIDNFTGHTGVHCTVNVWARLVEGSLTLTEGFLQKDSYRRVLTEGILQRSQKGSYRRSLRRCNLEVYYW